MIYFKDDRITLLHGHVLDELRTLPDESVHCCVTSPPYFGLRNYGLPPSVWGGDCKCDHDWTSRRYYTGKSASAETDEAFSEAGEENAARLPQSRWREDATCAKCGAWRGCLGLEPTLEMFIEHIVEVMREVRRVLQHDGVCWFNMGDSFAASGRGGGGGSLNDEDVGKKVDESNNRRKPIEGFKEKDLLLVPSRCAIAMQEDGWYVRSEVVWHKLVPMPESVKDRPTKAHEMVYLLTKSPRYHYDWEAIATDAKNPEDDVRRITERASEEHKTMPTDEVNGLRPRANREVRTKVNARDVWSLGPESFPGAHFATMPTELAKRCLLSGTPKAVCSACASAYEYEYEYEGSSWEERKEQGAPMRYGLESPKGTAMNKMGQSSIKNRKQVATCQCNAPSARSIVLDPFNGAATTGYVARELGFNYIGIELNPEYLEISKKRLAQGQLF